MGLEKASHGNKSGPEKSLIINTLVLKQLNVQKDRPQEKTAGGGWLSVKQSNNKDVLACRPFSVGGVIFHLPL